MPKSTAKAKVIYTPADLNLPEHAIATFTSKEIGGWVFNFQGIGGEPEPYDVMEIIGTVGEQNSSFVVFKNPYQLTVTIKNEL